MDQNLVIVTSVLSGAWAVLLVLCVVLFVQVAGLKRKINEMNATGRIRVQKLKMDPDKNHAFHNATIAPNEELSRRGYSMYVGHEDDVESGRGTERQTGGQFVEELTRELDSRQQRQTSAPPFLLQSIEENKRKSRHLNNISNAQRKSDTNHNFIY